MSLERVIANHARDFSCLRLEIELIDPFEPGGGRIWRRDQSPLLKLNSMLRDVTVFTDDSCSFEGPVSTGPSLAEWVGLVRSGRIRLPDWADRRLRSEVESIDDEDFPTRRLNCAYLGWAYREVLRRDHANVRVSWREGYVTAVEASRDPGGTEEVYLADGTRLAADLVVHTLGHNGSEPSSESAALQRFAERHGLSYVAPAFTADVDFDWLPAGEDVIVRGMGLAAIDLVVMLTEGRGGRFFRDVQQNAHDSRSGLSYVPSGAEPVLYLGSRRGVPYRSKTTSSIAGDAVRLEYLGPEFHEWVTDRNQPIDFEREVWPLVAAEMLTGYYRELFTGHPERVLGTWDEFAGQLRRILSEPHGYRSAELLDLVHARVADPIDRFDLESFDRPLRFSAKSTAPSKQRNQSRAEVLDSDIAVHERVSEHIADDLTCRTAQQHSANHALFLTLLHAYFSVAEVPREKWNSRSLCQSLPGRWHSYFSYLASGPPGHRLEELLALANAGVVRFLGADVQLISDEHGGTFSASGTARSDRHGVEALVRSHVAAKTLIDAWLPDATATNSDNPLLRQLVESGQAKEVTFADADYSGSTGQLMVTDDARLPDTERQFALGPFTARPTGGAFTRPGIDSLSFRRHDALARAILSKAASIDGERYETRREDLLDDAAAPL